MAIYVLFLDSWAATRIGKDYRRQPSCLAYAIAVQNAVCKISTMVEKRRAVT